VSNYTVSQLARMAGITVRALHHYDHIGLLEPAGRTESGYRLYGERELLRLQQILLFRELDLPLSEVRSILDEPGFDPLEALQNHRQVLQRRMDRLGRLLTTIDKTIHRLTEGDMGMTDEELYEGLSKEQIERYQREAREMYDPELVRESEQRVRKMSKARREAIKAEGDQVTRSLAALMDREPSDAEVQVWIARHHAWIENFYPCSAEVYRGLGQGYAHHVEFRAFYDKYRPGLADFLAKAMAYYADGVLACKD
jgi:DNA-binding transcriptional MerR regulator